MHGLPFMIGALAVLAIGYRYYSAFMAAKVAVLDDTRPTPAHTLEDGQNYHPTNRWVLFGHHFAAISGAGPLIGPVLALQFGFLPGFLWILIGVVIGGAVHDFIILFASVRHNGKSLAEIAKREIGPVAGVTAAIATLFIVTIALAGLALVVVNALAESPWGAFTIACTIPIALFMGLYMYRLRRGRIVEGTTIGVILLIVAVIVGRFIPESSWASTFTLTRHQLIIAIAGYGFVASVLPVWMLLCPRDYLSSFMKIGTIAALVVGVMIVNPTLHMAPVTEFIHGGGPIIKGNVFPFVFITIACGAISGFHSLVGSGTTPKMIDRESDIRPIGYGAMLVEGLVGITSLVAAASLFPGDYFAINAVNFDATAAGFPPVNLDLLAREVGEEIAGRAGGAVSLAVGIAQIFSNLPGMAGLMKYWYHYAIMFEALFILTTIDTGSRVMRFLVQEYLGKFWKPLERTDWLPANLGTSLLVVLSWAYFVWTGSISTIWPMFGIANQLLSVVALSIGTTLIINLGRPRYCWTTALPMAFVATTTLLAGWQSIQSIFWPRGDFQGYLNSVVTAVMMSLVVIILANALARWRRSFLSPATIAEWSTNAHR
ncbi:MAG: carbon starvation protein A [Acidobacteria bacterium]|nr:carbon starvation protein A [Acidobacteriota bacterium]